MSNYIKNREEMRKIQDEFLKYLQSLWSLKMPNTMWTCITTKSSELVEQFEADSLKKGRWTPILVEELKSKLDEVGKKFYSDYQWKGIKFACSALVTTYGGVVTLGGLFAAPAAAATVTSTEFLPGAILFLQGVASAVAGRILRGGL
ncbi:hypothetical protein GDO86_006778 [Hymenochirus boettgeri]|uniref:Uncharacterized protein n=1 Tax=Hymenochirus boettgeri TaxID=247094 RepID=A0A8T2JCE4_9PIPI|nr:hypothetical protein GDO86_006778 [Hymenochirus boettgeri]